MRRLAILLATVFLFFAQFTYAGPKRVLVWLDGDPLAEVNARSVPLPGLFRPLRIQDFDMQAHRERLRVERQAVRSQLERLGFVTDGETDVVLHTLIGRMPEENIEEATTLPGIRLLRPVKEYRPLMDAAGPLIKVADTWLLLGGETQAGAGMKIAIIDTGIDITNPMLQDASLKFPSGFPKGDPNYTNTKVIVARDYVAILGEISEPREAMDRMGHGTFVAAVAAGRRALGPLAEVVGVAPAAQAGNYRVYTGPTLGSLGEGYTTDAAIIAAINDAVADGMNVINISSGGYPMDLPAESPTPRAVAAAVKAGVTVVVSAGNDGMPASISDPGNATEAITVGAASNSRKFAYALRVLDPSPLPEVSQRTPIVPASYVTMSAAFGPASAWVLQGDPCKTIAATDEVEGKIVFFSRADWLRCGATSMSNLASAKALAAVVFRNDDKDPATMGYVTPPLIPSFQIAKAAAIPLIALPTFNGSGRAVIDANKGAFSIPADALASFSSLGPNNDLQLKPDLVAPGVYIYAGCQQNDQYGDMYSIDQFIVSSGTSFSSPMVAGAAALLKQSHPFWTPAQIKSALTNTANPSVFVSGGTDPAGITGAGAGRLDISRAINSAAVFEPVSLSFSNRLLAQDTVLHKSLKVTNTGTTAESFSVKIAPTAEVTGGSVTVTPASLALKPAESGTIDVTYTVPRASTRPREMDGRLIVQAGSGAAYSVPYWGKQVGETSLEHIYAIRGNAQTAPVSSTLPRELGAQVYDTDFVPVAGVPVKFEVTKGTAKLSAASVTTDDTGVAAITVQLPDVPGPVNIKASVSEDIDDTFYLTARPSPVAPKGGIVNAASYAGTVTPGGIVSIFGTGLANGTAQADTKPLPVTLASTQVLFNNKPSPLFFVSPGQINALVPFELAGATTAEMRIAVKGAFSPPITVQISQAGPGILTLSQDGKGPLLAQHGSDYSVVTTDSPARPGEALVLYGVGFGPVEPAVASGVPAPVPPAAVSGSCRLKVGSKDATVYFCGLTPGLVGLYQLNFQVPEGTAAGTAVPVVLTIGTATSNTVTLPVK